MHYVNLMFVRRHMVTELEKDIADRNLYLSSRLTDEGKAGWADLLKEAVQSQSDEWLANQIRGRGWLLQYETRRKAAGGFTQALVPANAHEMLAEGEFNRLYIRAVCIEAIERNIDHVVVYRAKEVANARAESLAKIGQSVEPHRLLADVRNSPGVDTALGLPQGPNSGLSIKLR